ncbi:MAG: hypothetical protein FD149_877 [Rhodospirillaceae bacterium]|nr:MAG: hypothetical protein FD149_877 [Rhodospirillaceae bacterium]
MNTDATKFATATTIYVTDSFTVLNGATDVNGTSVNNATILRNWQAGTGALALKDRIVAVATDTGDWVTTGTTDWTNGATLAADDTTTGALEAAAVTGQAPVRLYVQATAETIQAAVTVGYNVVNGVQAKVDGFIVTDGGSLSFSKAEILKYSDGVKSLDPTLTPEVTVRDTGLLATVIAATSDAATSTTPAKVTLATLAKRGVTTLDDTGMTGGTSATTLKITLAQSKLLVEKGIGFADDTEVWLNISNNDLNNTAIATLFFAAGIDRLATDTGAERSSLTLTAARYKELTDKGLSFNEGTGTSVVITAATVEQIAGISAEALAAVDRIQNTDTSTGWWGSNGGTTKLTVTVAQAAELIRIANTPLDSSGSWGQGLWTDEFVIKDSAANLKEFFGIVANSTSGEGADTLLKSLFDTWNTAISYDHVSFAVNDGETLKLSVAEAKKLLYPSYTDVYSNRLITFDTDSSVIVSDANDVILREIANNGRIVKDLKSHGVDTFDSANSPVVDLKIAHAKALADGGMSFNTTTTNPAERDRVSVVATASELKALTLTVVKKLLVAGYEKITLSDSIMNLTVSNVRTLSQKVDVGSGVLKSLSINATDKVVNLVDSPINVTGLKAADPTKNEIGDVAKMVTLGIKKIDVSGTGKVTISSEVAAELLGKIKFNTNDAVTPSPLTTAALPTLP